MVCNSYSSNDILAEPSQTRRRSGRLQPSTALDDEDPQDGSSDDVSSTTTPHAMDGSTARTSPGISTVERAQNLDNEADDEEKVATPVHTVVGSLSTTDEYMWMICQICHTYGVRVLNMPDIASHMRTLEQAVREDNRLALCMSFAKIMTILVITSANASSGFLDEEYENMVNSAVAEFGMALLSKNEGAIFMESMGRAMIAGQSEDLSMAYAALRGSMIAYAGRQ